MKLTKLVEQYLDEVSPKSPAAKEAEQLGLVYRGYGKYEDPANPGVTVAKTIQGKLVKVDPNAAEEPAAARPAAGTAVADAPSGTDAGWSGPHKGTAGPSMMTPEIEPEPDSYTAPDSEIEGEPEIPKKDDVVERLLNSANGDYMKVKKVLAKKIRDGNEGAKELMDRVNAHEKAEHEKMMLGVQAVQARKDAQLAARKEKYAAKYPSPQI